MRKKVIIPGVLAGIALIALSGIAVIRPKKSPESAGELRASLLAGGTSLAREVPQTPEAAGNPGPGKGVAAIRGAAEAKKYLFVFFYSTEDQPTHTMREVFEAAMSKVGDRAESVAVSTTDPSEKDIVKTFGVARAPMPLALALAPNGAVTRAFPLRLDEKQLLGAFATPCMEKCLKALQERKLVLLCVQNGRTDQNAAAMQGVDEFKADRRFAQATEIVVLDPDDPAETKFLKDLRIDPGTGEAVTLFLAPPGAQIARFQGGTEKDRLVAALVSAMSNCASGCGPSGCGP